MYSVKVGKVSHEKKIIFSFRQIFLLYNVLLFEFSWEKEPLICASRRIWSDALNKDQIYVLWKSTAVIHKSDNYDPLFFI